MAGGVSGSDGIGRDGAREDDVDSAVRRSLVETEDGGQIREHNHVDSVLLRRCNSFHLVSRPRIADGI
jgi:hypothetical protein